MKFFLIFLFFLLVLIPLVVSRAIAVSPMPQEIEKEIGKKTSEKLRLGEGGAVCKVNIAYAGDVISGKPSREDFSSSVIIEGPTQKKDAFEKAIRSIEDKLKEEDISEVKIDCKFQELRSKE